METLLAVIGVLLTAIGVLGTFFLISTQTSMPHAANIRWSSGYDEDHHSCHVLTFIYKTSISSCHLESVRVSGHRIYDWKGGGCLRRDWAKESYVYDLEYLPEDPACSFCFACFPCSEESKTPFLILRCRWWGIRFTRKFQLRESPN